MKLRLLDQDLTPDIYNDYIAKIVDIFHLSSKKSSILFDMKIKNYQATIKLSILNQSGGRDWYQDEIMKCDYDFYHKFLLPLVQKLSESGEIAIKDIVHLSENEDLVTFRMITTNNDLFSIDGLSTDDANALLNICGENNSKKKSNISTMDGKGSFWLFLMLVILLLFIIGIIIIVG